MSLVAAGILGIVVGYGLALWREQHRVRNCERDCSALREYCRRLLRSDQQVTMLFLQNERLARQLVLQAACDKTRSDTP